MQDFCKKTLIFFCGKNERDISYISGAKVSKIFETTKFFTKKMRFIFKKIFNHLKTAVISLTDYGYKDKSKKWNHKIFYQLFFKKM